ncbi:MAG: shikimate dehydrogenase [Bacteroidetes bacterium]|nr:shikimate dehydrogenase [Bacteroidota bacterium]MBV6461625.1 Shikimate dehydrogenase (NADP(+)) [Flavobacteriales bacterium]WKZ74103.1 MAG: shikimate dehydrogenase [Vicingaceae bacterium]MCL4816776.1 shikimate dehydrogenase [Flavobacteriales bacterium]NOG95714.1 shikimate dehydrogenase [Bacteroidota bacterium]
MKTYGLVGFPLSHSFSKTYFTEKFLKENIQNCEYLNFELEKISFLPELLESNQNIVGFNVTVPYKQSIIPYLHELDKTAEKIGAVNTVKINKGKLIGYNTDEYGFRFSLKPFLEKKHRNALILGNGGASRAVQYVLKDLGIEYTIAQRNPEKKEHLSFTEITEKVIQYHLLIINTTPVGMYPNVNACIDLPYHCISKEHLLYDLIYNPAKTLFLKKAEQQNASTINGLSMLQLQAEKAWNIWNNH